MASEIQSASTDAEIQGCFEVMKELRPDLKQDTFVASIRHLESTFGYQLVYLSSNDEVVSVAGFRVSESLAWGKHVYLDDFVTASTHRSQGHGKKLLEWIKNYGRQNDCVQLHLDSRLHRVEAHAFYEREGVAKAGYHFYASLDEA